MATLPKELNYTSKLQALPSSTRTISAVISPNNGTTFNQNGDIVAFDLGARGYLVPNSLYLRYRAAVTVGATETVMFGTPYTTPFSRMEVIIGNNTVETIQDFNKVCNFITTCKLNTAQKAAVAAAFGNYNHTGGVSRTDGKLIPAATTTNCDMAGPLNCILSNCENLFPLGLAPAVRIQLTTESIAQMFEFNATAQAVELSRVELCYDFIEFGPEIDQVVRSMADANGELIIKSQSYSSSSLYMPSGSSGQLEYSFNQRLSSIKSIFSIVSQTATTAAGGARKFGAIDPTSGSGSTQFFIGSEAYPPRPLEATNKAGMYMELLSAWGNNASVESYNTSITPTEYFINDADTEILSTKSKHYVGCNVERMCGSALLTGVSSQLSPISVRINIPSVTTKNCNVSLITCYDALISLNVVTRQASVKS
jgi:hypothetical protein